MKTLSELIEITEPAIKHLKDWASDASNSVTILDAGDNREDTLLGVQVTTRSVLGALAYDTGGILIDNGWVSAGESTRH